VALALNVTAAPAGLVHSAVISAGQFTVTAAVPSILTRKLQEPVLPVASVAVQVTVVVPMANMLPLAGLHAIVAPGQLSLTPALKLTTAPHSPGSLGCVISPGQLGSGGWASITRTSKLHWAVLPAASVAVQVTVVTPMGKKLPLAGLHEKVAPGQLSLTLAL
jgi:hypothetical protein